MTRDIQAMALQVRQALTGLGFCYQCKDGSLVEVSFKGLQRAGDRYAILELDPHRLPPRVSIPALESDRVLAHLSAVVGFPVRRLNTVGLSYVVCFERAPKLPPMPARAELGPRPEGMPYAWPFGVDRAGRQVWQSLDKTGHILLAGQTGSGKSTLLSLALVSLFDQHGPDELQALLIDPKAVELAPFAGLPHLAQAVAVTPAAASSAVGWLVQEVDRRQALFAGAGSKNLAGYNAKAAQPLPRLLVVIDEVVSLVLGGWGGVRAEPYRALVDAAVRARAFGVTLVFAGQSARADVLDLVREQCGVKLALRLDTPYASKAALGVTGAETLPAKTPGRMLAAGLTPTGLETLQGFYLPEAELEARLATLRGRLPSPISEQERVFVTYAARDLGGAFKVQVLYEAFKGSDWHMSWPALRKLAERWELRGWLTPQANSATARQITPELLRVAGLDPAGGQAL